MVCEITCEKDVWLGFYEITTVSLVVAFYWNTVYNMQKMQ